MTASRHPRWNPRLRSSHGYPKVRVGRQHPLADGHGYAYEHDIVLASAGVPDVGPGQVIHHCNGDRTDNRLENLLVLDRAEHSREHAARQMRKRNGRWA